MSEKDVFKHMEERIVSKQTNTWETKPVSEQRNAWRKRSVLEEYLKKHMERNCVKANRHTKKKYPCQSRQPHGGMKSVSEEDPTNTWKKIILSKQQTLEGKRVCQKRTQQTHGRILCQSKQTHGGKQVCQKGDPTNTRK